jgi:fucose permease
MRHALRLVWHDRRLLRLTFASFAYIAMQVSANTFLVTWMVQDLERSLVQAGIAFAALQIGGFAGRLLWGLICGPRLRPHTVLVFLGVGMAVCSLGLWLATPAIADGLLIALGLATGLTVAGWNALFLAEVARLSPAGEVGRVTSASFLFGSIGLVLGPVFFSIIAAATRYGTAFLVMGAVALAGVIVLLGERSGTRARPV